MSMTFRFATDSPTLVSVNVSCSFVSINFNNGQLTTVLDSLRQRQSTHICQKRGLHLDPQLFLDKSPIQVVEETKYWVLYLTGNYLLYPILNKLKRRV